MAENEVVLEVDGIVKHFPGVLANDNVSLALHRGEILALLGENGAGKSTLMNIIYGLYHADHGMIRIKGREVRFASPREAIRSGIGMVHQHFQLIPVMTVAENVVLGEEADVSYQGKGSPLLEFLLRWLPSIVLLVLGTILGGALGEAKYLRGGMAAGALLGIGVAVPPLARLVWGAAWRVGLAFLAVWIAVRLELAVQMGLTDIALRQQVEVVTGETVETQIVSHERIDFNWRREARDSEEAGTGIRGIVASAKTQMEPYRDKGIPGGGCRWS
jgi:ABC-type sugar transport system ATPase subunit